MLNALNPIKIKRSTPIVHSEIFPRKIFMTSHLQETRGLTQLGREEHKCFK